MNFLKKVEIQWNEIKNKKIILLLLLFLYLLFALYFIFLFFLIAPFKG